VAQALVSIVPLQTTYLKAVMPRRNFMEHEEMLRRMRGVVDDEEGLIMGGPHMRGVVDDEEEDLWDLVLAAALNTATARQRMLRQYFDEWTFFCPFWSGCFKLP
jgi:hypothetical protein